MIATGSLDASLGRTAELLVYLGFILLWASVVGAFWREEFRVDLSSPAYTWRKGLWLLPRKITCGLLEAIQMAPVYGGTSGSAEHGWAVILILEGADPLLLAECDTREEAWRQHLLPWAKKLRLPARVSDENGEMNVPWEFLSESGGPLG
jgi:hypothetical protein